MANWGKIEDRGEVEDRRSFGPAMAGGIGLTGVAIAFLVSALTGVDPRSILNELESLPVEQTKTQNSSFEGQDEYEVFASTVLGSNNSYWNRVFKQSNKTYQEPRLVLFREATNSGCGVATSEVGPHYCQLDSTIYLDETFFDELVKLLGAQGGDVSEAYVISHEVGHHIQNQLGVFSSLASQTREDSIKLELQADCYAGLWANSIKDADVFEENEIKEAMDAASSVGDDRIQEKVAGYVNPETWTHGSGQQRLDAFNTGYTQKEVSACNTNKF